MNFLGKYMQIKKRNAKIAWKKAKMSKTCYLFILHFARADVSILQFHVL